MLPGRLHQHKWLLRLAAPFGRQRDANFFALIGAHRSKPRRCFVIGSQCTYKADRDGELWCFPTMSG